MPNPDAARTIAFGFHISGSIPDAETAGRSDRFDPASGARPSQGVDDSLPVAQAGRSLHARVFVTKPAVIAETIRATACLVRRRPAMVEVKIKTSRLPIVQKQRASFVGVAKSKSRARRQVCGYFPRPRRYRSSYRTEWESPLGFKVIRPSKRIDAAQRPDARPLVVEARTENFPTMPANRPSTRPGFPRRTVQRQPQRTGMPHEIGRRAPHLGIPPWCPE